MKNIIKAVLAVAVLAGAAGAETKLASELPGIYAQSKALPHKVNFAVGPVSITVQPANFIMGAVTAKLACHFEDGSGAVQSYPEANLPVIVTQEGKLYRLDIAAGKLSKYSLFASARSCGYLLEVNSTGPYVASAGVVPLAGSDYLSMTETELAALLSDQNLARKISDRNQPLTLVARGGYIYGIHLAADRN